MCNQWLIDTRLYNSAETLYSTTVWMSCMYGIMEHVCYSRLIHNCKIVQKLFIVLQLNAVHVWNVNTCVQWSIDNWLAWDNNTTQPQLANWSSTYNRLRYNILESITPFSKQSVWFYRRMIFVVDDTVLVLKNHTTSNVWWRRL